MNNNVYLRLLNIINRDKKSFNILVEADNVLGLNVTIDEIIDYLEFANMDKLINGTIIGNILITEGDVLSILKIIHDLIYYRGEYIIYINGDNVGTITYLVTKANEIYKSLGLELFIKIDYSENYNSYLNSNVTILGSQDFINSSCDDFKNYNLVIV